MERIRLLYVIYAKTFGGAEQLVLELAKFIPKDKFEVAVCCLKKGRLYQELQYLNIRTYLVTLRKIIDFKAIRGLRELYNDFNPHIIHSHLPRADLYSRLALKKKKYNQIIMITTIHNLEKVRENFLYNLIDIHLSKRNELFIAVSQAVKNHFLSYVPSARDKTIVILNGVNIERFQNVNKEKGYEILNLSPNNFIIGTIGRLSPQKDHINLIKSAKMVISNSNKPIHFVIVGDGVLMSSLKKEINDLNLNDRIHLIGHRKEIPEILACFDIFVLSSRWEGLPITLLEAMASAKPVVATSVGGVPELVENGKTGILVPPLNPEQLAMALLKLIEDDTMRTQFGKFALDVVKRKYDIKDYISKHLNYYEKLYNEKFSD